MSICLNRSPQSDCMSWVQLFHGFWKQCSKAIKFCVGRFPKLLQWSKKKLVLKAVLGGCSLFIFFFRTVLVGTEVWGGIVGAMGWVQTSTYLCWDLQTAGTELHFQKVGGGSGGGGGKFKGKRLRIRKENGFVCLNATHHSARWVGCKNQFMLRRK